MYVGYRGNFGWSALQSVALALGESNFSHRLRVWHCFRLNTVCILALSLIHI